MIQEIRMRELFGDGPSADQRLSDEAAAVKYRLREIEPFWRVFDSFVFDFTGVDTITPGFAHALFGRLAEQHGDWVKDKLRFIHLTRETEWTLLSVIEENIRSYRFQPRA